MGNMQNTQSNAASNEPVILDGTRIASEIAAEMQPRVQRFISLSGHTPKLATILVGDDPSSATYVRMKGRKCQELGMDSISLVMPSNTSTEAVIQKIEELNHAKDVYGILLQHPVPRHVDERKCFDAIQLSKDVDGVTSLGFGMMSMGQPGIYGSATPKGIMLLLERYGISVEGKHAVVVGRSPILGKPMALMLLNANATVTICHSRTLNLIDQVRQADIVIGAVGVPELIKHDWIKDGAIVIDAGYHRVEAEGISRQVGDIELSGIKSRCAAYTPVPGGVGPMTIATLMLQTLESAERSLGL